MSKLESSAVGSPLPTTTEPGRELDAVIAEKVFGLTPREWRYRCYVERHERDEEWCYACGDLVGDGKAAERIPSRYSTEIESAWSVVDKVMETAWSFEAIGNHESRPRFAFTAANGDGFSRRGDTIPHAICLAALAALENASAGAPPSTGGGQ